MKRLSRRTFVLSGLATAGAVALPLTAAQAAVPFPFKLGVASGEPAADSVVLWTRLAPSPLNADGQGGMANADVTVDWQVSTTDTFSSLVASGSVTARYADAHSVHVVAGGLAPDAEYYYRFRAQGHISPVGRTRTAPAPGTVGRDLVMAFASCAHYESGYYTAYRRMAEERPDLILHLGDYIYEGGTGTGGVRAHVGAEIVSLADYRRRYAQYKSDPDLQAAHAIAPWLVVPDDHEVENNYANMVRNDSSPALTTAQWTARRTAAYRAYYENMPLRPSQAPSGNSIPLYRRVRWGTLATFHMLDTRQFRDDQACGDGWKVCADADSATRSLTGAAQEAWLLDGLAQHYGTWDILGQQVFFARQFDASGAASMDAWDGYRASRARIQQGWIDRSVRNPLVLTGDVHAAWANDLKADYANSGSATIGTELVCTSITSGGNGSAATAIPNVATNPHLKFHSGLRGYVRTTISPAQVRADFRAVATVTEHGAPATTLKSFAILDGQPGLRAL
ncbi:alkaline phosphatase D family protein [Dactylosporangium aurantiacum]|uniref:Alkaline phosphatase D family protein n=1 Tax=Dactylosporangium aurantiacum TaxID=35754 RepID=A0A9Q9IMI4_9ACTN|nr:alkaline phosphatase D family protein [Dactylosporangium aurantiacum]MDG6104757.1 alkaline phosphatase D family protein [Dactylosporangium aurantiacum]UWZ55680.1 alkaline phosphatase D family protein [Dactylosporangium aurantiacum]